MVESLCPSDAPLKVLLVGAFSRYSGYGSDLIDMADALVRKGVDVYLQPIGLQAPLPDTVAELLTKTLEAPFDIIINHTDPGTMRSSSEQKRSADLIVGWTMWEMSTCDNLRGKSTFKKRVKDFDGMYGYSDVSVDALRPIAPNNMPFATLQGGYNDHLWPYMDRDWDSDRFSFIMNGQLGPRKGVLAAVRAFSELKLEYPEEFEPAEFHLHNTLPSLPPMIEESIHKLRVHYRTFSDAEMHEFYRMGHVLLAPSRGEGKNLPALEMLSTGGGVIYTNWSGHTWWGSSDYAYPLDYELVPMGIPKHFECMWAEPDVKHLKQLMLHCFRHRSEVKSKGLLASKVIPAMCSWDRVMDDFFRRLPQLNEEKGNIIAEKYQEALTQNSIYDYEESRYARS